MKTIHVRGYPCNLIFEVKVKLPRFKKYRCAKRNRILRQQLRKNSELWSNVPHMAEDFVVEQVRSFKNGVEIWEVAS